MSYNIPYAYLTQGDLEKTQGSSEKNNYNEPYGERFYTSVNTFTKAFSLLENGKTARDFSNKYVS